MTEATPIPMTDYTVEDCLQAVSEGNTEALLELRRYRSLKLDGAGVRARKLGIRADVDAAELDLRLFDEAVARAMLQANVEWPVRLEAVYAGTGDECHVRVFVLPYVSYLWRVAQRLMRQAA